MEIITQQGFLGVSIIIVAALQVITLVAVVVFRSRTSQGQGGVEAKTAKPESNLSDVAEKLRNAEREQERIRRNYEESLRRENSPGGDRPSGDSRRGGSHQQRFRPQQGRDGNSYPPRNRDFSQGREGGRPPQRDHSRDSQGYRGSRPQRDFRPEREPRESQPLPEAREEREPIQAPITPVPPVVEAAPSSQQESSQDVHGRRPVLKRRNLEESEIKLQNPPETTSGEGAPLA